MKLANLSVTWFLVGLIWIIQLVHYPSFTHIDEAVFQNFHHFHTSSIAWVVVPTMILELVLAIVLVWKTRFTWHYLFPFVLVAAIWLSTVFLQIPIHSKLAISYDEELISRLVQTNWIRTALWTIKGLWLLWIHSSVQRNEYA